MSKNTREDGRACNELRPITITRGWSLNAEGCAPHPSPKACLAGSKVKAKGG